MPPHEHAQDEEDESEPSLKYEALTGDLVREVVGGTGAAPPTDGISCLHPSARFLVVGTTSGKVHILDYAGNLVRHGCLLSACAHAARVVSCCPGRMLAVASTCCGVHAPILMGAGASAARAVSARAQSQRGRG